MRFQILLTSFFLLARTLAVPAAVQSSSNVELVSLTQHVNGTRLGSTIQAANLSESFSYRIPGTAMTLSLRISNEQLDEDALLETLRGAQIFVSEQAEKGRVAGGFGWPPWGGSPVKFYIEALDAALKWHRLYDILGGLTTIVYEEHRRRSTTFSVDLDLPEGQITIGNGFIKKQPLVSQPLHSASTLPDTS